ncbi:MAG TPA: DNA replication/repair protein RecF, partial [Candidatus Krumholzibacteria bacterium]|nr:DNA replication/repair protein RecF [Candidatus Krumholzibacteria bacterium]
MRVLRFLSTSFRNLAPDEIEFGSGLNFIIGENGQGKTNLLEAVYFFRHGRSFRATNDTEMIRFDEPFCRAELHASFDDGHDESFAFSVERRGTKTIKIDGQVLPRRSDLAGRFPAVLFGPGDLRVVSGEPEHRRRFLDMVGTMTDPAYLRSARDYRRTLEQRNAALKARAGREELAAWNERLVASGVDLTSRRRELVGLIEIEMAAHARDVESPFAFSMRYESMLLNEAGDAITLEAGLTRAFHEKLAAVASEEARRGITLVGPHRDDVAFRMAGRDLADFASRGQQRTAILALKLAELDLLTARDGRPPLLLLDDVFSELDPLRRGHLVRRIAELPQAFVTTTTLDDLDPGLRAAA